MKIMVLTLLMMTALTTTAFAQEKRCGWIANPTPGNYWITDAQDTWTMAVQGGYQAEGLDKLQYPNNDQYVETNGNYGYFCGCVSANFNKETLYVEFIKNASAELLKTCLEDPNLP